MQSEVVFVSSAVSTIVSMIVATYLIHKWYNQKTRLPFDLPLMFGIVFVASAVSQFIKSSQMVGLLPATLEIFRVRSLVIAWIFLPWTLVLLRIMWPSGEKWHMRLWGVLTVVTIGMSLFAASQALIQTYQTTWILIVIIGVIITFAITWKTGRLKEVRSELVLLGSLLAIVSQIGQIVWAAVGLSWIADVITVLSITAYTLALINPWFQSKEVLMSSETVYVTG
ncbi:MAG: hypothetical protein ACFFAY_00210 [Promethearchaeota archaeon]